MQATAVTSTNAAPPTADDYSRVFKRLCHLMALSSRSDLDRVVDRLVTIAFVFDRRRKPTATPDDVIHSIRRTFAIKLDRPIVIASLRRLTEIGTIVGGGTPPMYSLSDQERQNLERAIALKQANEGKVRNDWFKGLSENYAKISAEYHPCLWKALHTYMTNAFHQHGAEVQRLLDPGINISRRDSQRLEIYMMQAAKECPELESSLVQSAINSFFREPDDHRSAYITELVDGTVALFALTVDDATRAFLSSQLQPVVLFLDTNFIYGLLDLHANPLDEASMDLIDLIKSNPSLDIKLVYHERTLDELRGRIRKDRQGLNVNRTWSKVASQSAIADGGFTGIELKFHRENVARGGGLDSRVWLARYQYLQDLLAEYGFEIYPSRGEADERLPSEADVSERYRKYLVKFPPSRERGEAQRDHDATVWLAVEEERLKYGASNKESPLEARAFLLTVDRSLRDFDQRYMHPGRVSSVVFPSQFLQLLRPFVNQSSDFDRRFSEIFRLSEFRWLPDFEDKLPGKRVVLAYLNQFGENMDRRTASKLLADDLLVKRMAVLSEEDPKAIDEEMTARLKEPYEELFHNAAAIEAERRAEEEGRKAEGQRREEAEQALKEKDRELLAEREIRNEAELSLSELKRELAEVKEEMEQLRHSQAEHDTVLHAWSDEKNGQIARRNQQLNAVKSIIVVFLVVGLAGCILIWNVADLVPWKKWGVADYRMQVIFVTMMVWYIALWSYNFNPSDRKSIASAVFFGLVIPLCFALSYRH